MEAGADLINRKGRTKMSITIRQFDELKDSINSLEKAIRGNNGELGILARINILERDLSALKVNVDKSLTELKAGMKQLVSTSESDHDKISSQNKLEMKSIYDSVQVISSESKVEMKQIYDAVRAMEKKLDEHLQYHSLKDKTEKDFGSFQWFRDLVAENINTVIIAIITALVMLGFSKIFP